MNTPLAPGHKGPSHHPLMLVAAGAVLLFCLAGIAAIMGWIPSSIGSNTGNGQLSESDRNALASQLHSTPQSGQPLRSLDAAPPAPRPAPVVPQQPLRAPVQLAEAAPAKNWCGNCGNVESIRTITTRAQGSGIGAAGGAVLGGLLGNQLGGGHGRQLATVAGAVGGAVVGNQVEGNMKADHSYEIQVRMDDGHVRTFHQQSAPGWRDGDRVRVVNGALRAVN